MSSLVTRRRFAVAAASAAVACAALPAMRARAQPMRVTVAVGGQGMLYNLPLLVAQRLGFFEAEGLQVAIHDYPGGSFALQAMQAGAAALCAGAYEHTLRLQARGEGVQAFVLQGRAPQFALGVSRRALPQYQGWGDLKGRRVGVSSPGSSTHLAASIVLARAGLAEGDVGFVGVGSGEGALAALRSGQVHALCHVDPLMTLLEQQGEVRLVADMRTPRGAQDWFGGPMPAGCLYAPEAFLRRNPDEAQALANGMVHALKWLQTAGPVDLLQAVPQGYLLGERGPYLAAFDRMRDTISPDGLMPGDGPVTALRALLRVLPGLAQERLSLGDTYTNEFARRAKQRFNA
ncbi:MAG: ABC transporter substrate-binding protein [Acidovorax sp.]